MLLPDRIEIVDIQRPIYLVDGSCFIDENTQLQINVCENCIHLRILIIAEIDGDCHENIGYLVIWYRTNVKRFVPTNPWKSSNHFTGWITSSYLDKK